MKFKTFAFRRLPSFSSKFVLMGMMLLLITTLLLAACGDSTATSTSATAANSSSTYTSLLESSTGNNTSPKPGKVGEPVQMGSYSLTVYSVEKSSKNFGGATRSTPKEGYYLLALDFSIGSTAAATGVSSKGEIKLKDVTTGTYFDWPLYGRDPLLPQEDNIAPGQAKRGWQIFEVPTSATNLVFEYYPPSASTRSASLPLSVAVQPTDMVAK